MFQVGDRRACLVVIAANVDGYAVYRCRCDCGAIVDVKAAFLSTRKSCGSSCGLPIGRKWSTPVLGPATIEQERKAKAGTRWRNLTRDAKKRGWTIEITRDQYDALTHTNARCHYCTGPLPLYGYGIDRIDSLVGYILGNVVPCCVFCNVAKGHMLSGDEYEAAMKVRIAKQSNAWEGWSGGGWHGARPAVKP